MSSGFLRAAVTSVVGVAVLPLLVGCQDDANRSDVSTDGPLSASVEPGVKAVYAPRRTPYDVTFGSYRLCTKSPTDDPLVLEEVNYNLETPPLSVEAYLRQVPDAAERQGDPMSWAPVGGVLGRPGDFSTGKVQGTFTEELAGYEVLDSCEDIAAYDHGFTELEIVMQVPEEGADIDGFTVKYRVGDKPYELSVPWRMIGCGSESPDNLCKP